MSTEAALQSAGLFLVVWIAFRLLPAIPANTKAWTWRFALLKPLIGLLPLAALSLHVLPAPSPVHFEGSSVPSVIGAETTQIASPAPQPSETPANPLLVVWLLGTAAVGGKGMQEMLRARRIAQHAAPVDCPALQNYLDELVLRGAKGQTVQLLVSSEAKTAMLVGRRIVLPNAALEASSLDDARLMIAHELAHLLRRDLGWLGLAWVVQSIFFFNPFVWLAVQASHEAHESATDAYALELADVPASRYAEMLVRTLVSHRPSLVPGAAYMSGSYRSIHRRLETMKHFRSPSNPWRKAALGALALTVVCLMPSYQLAQASPPQGRPGGGGGVQVPGDNPWCWVSALDPANPDLLSCGFNQYDVRQALTKVLQRQRKSFRIDPKVKGTVTVTVSLWNVTLGISLTNITRQVGADYVIERGVYVIGLRPPTTTVTPIVTSPSGPVTYKDVQISVEFEKADAREVLRQLFRSAPDRSYSIDPMVQGTITVSIKNVTFDVALQNVLRQVNGNFQLKNGVYYITSNVKPPLG